MQKSTQPILSLKDFILKQQVKNLYRRIFRTIKKIEDKSERCELQEWARRDFRANSHLSDDLSIKMCLQYGERCLKQLETNLALAK